MGKVEDERGNVKSLRPFWDVPQFERDLTLYLDEADIYFDCDNFKNLKPVIHRFLKQHRKRNIRMVFIVQDVRNLVVYIRRLAQEFVVCHKDSSGRAGWVLPGFERFVRTSYATEELRKPIRTGMMLERHALPIYRWFDSKQLI